MRTVAWVSAGAASAVAAKLTPGAVLAYIDPGSEHPDNERFLADLETWLERPIARLRSERYSDTWQVWTERRFLRSARGALCTTELKKRVRQDFERPGDVQIFGFTVEESSRADRFREQNPEIALRCPLIDAGYNKADCLATIETAGIELPSMYRLGYGNNNCIGCVKGGAGYWNKIRRDFPDTFTRMATLERKLGATVLRRDGEALYLDELPAGDGREPVLPIQCSLYCDAALDNVANSDNSA